MDGVTQFSMGPWHVLAVPCLRDNYAYLVRRGDDNEDCVIVDACETEPILSALTAHRLRPQAILSTHHHNDHVGGNLALARKYGVPIVGHESEQNRITGLDTPVADQQTFSVGDVEVVALHVPGHTLGALAYRMGEICFTGDTLFCAGCGRLFEGSAAQMHHSLVDVLGRLPDETVFFTGHEYTAANLRFAAAVLPRPSVALRQEQIAGERAQERCCASATLAVEKVTNPFLNAHDPVLQETVWGEAYQDAVRRYDSQQMQLLTFTELRRMKDQF
jgi:hydroxyacylglutathione hydrolase